MTGRASNAMWRTQRQFALACPKPETSFRYAPINAQLRRLGGSLRVPG